MRANLFQSSGLWWCVIRIEGEKKRGCRGCRDCQKTAALSFYGLIPEKSRTLFSLYSFLLSNDFFRFTVLDGNDFPHIAMGEKTEKIYFSSDIGHAIFEIEIFIIWFNIQKNLFKYYDKLILEINFLLNEK